ncbi:MAG TPA: hypothetical protein PKE45_03160 [Caldilineaceae bacterium]|nr:hypothetical protein [Caldilineaceae bacterium]
MPLQILTAILPESVAPWLAMIGFGAYHGLNPGMGWLFALSLGLQRRSERAIWLPLLPIAAGHAASLAVVAVIVLAAGQLLSTTVLEVTTALALLGFGAYKVVHYYRHPRWVGMNVGLRDLTWWSFLMAMAHGAGLMIAPALIGIAAAQHAHHSHGGAGLGVSLGVAAHTASMLLVMMVVAWFVYKRFGLAILRQRWVNFDLIWAVALIIVGGIALVSALV